MSAGIFVTFEGGEGAGKSTLIGSLAAWLREEGHEVLVTREPGGSPLAERLRALLLAGAFRDGGPEAEAAVFAAARSDHISKTIGPALDAGAIVLCDRFFDSTRVYQGFAGSVDHALLTELEREAVGDRRPDVTLVLDCPVEIGLARASARRGAGAAVDRFEAEGVAFHSRVREGFLAVAAADPGRCRVVDASRDADTTLSLAREALAPLLRKPAQAGPRVP